MGLFGGGDDKAAKQAELQAEADRVGALSLEDLAVEMMERVFGPGGPGAEGDAPLFDATELYAPMGPIFGVDYAPRNAVEACLAEGLQVLEHAGLVRLHVSGGDTTSVTYLITRLGSRSLDHGDVRAQVQRVIA
jgi:uncharacterized protein YgbK (DUF1537 family)